MGNRLALWALAKEYGKTDLVYSGPLYKAMKVEGGKIRLSFAHVGGGLKSRDGKPLTEFEIAGADGKFVPAEATIDGDTVIVQAKQVATPTQARFGWRNVANPNLVNKEGCPPRRSRPTTGRAERASECPAKAVIRAARYCHCPGSVWIGPPGHAGDDRPAFQRQAAASTSAPPWSTSWRWPWTAVDGRRPADGVGAHEIVLGGTSGPMAGPALAWSVLPRIRVWNSGRGPGTRRDVNKNWGSERTIYYARGSLACLMGDFDGFPWLRRSAPPP